MDHQSAIWRVPLGPCAVEFAVEREGGAFVGCVAYGKQGEEDGPEEKAVDRKERAGVEDGACETDSEGEECKGRE